MFPSREITLEAALDDLGSALWEVRARAAGALGSCAPADRERAAAALRRALRDDRGEVRYAAALSLAELTDALAVPALIDQLEDGDPRAREAAALALGRIGDAARAWQPLEVALREGPPEVRFQAAASLAELDAARAAPLLRPALSDSDPEVRANAAAGLGNAPPEPVTKDALALLLEDPHPEPRFEAAYALALHRDRRATEILASYLSDPERALDAAQALTWLADPRSEPALRRVLRRFLAPTLLKVRAAHALARLGEPEGRARLEKAARSRREDVRGLARECLDELAARDH
ncbi:MAG TPA: HEAT repeat domain-containing protein [Polyangia bacterium]|nr:HEAT repeat domain-containing protein [Polyangia bacterium]